MSKYYLWKRFLGNTVNSLLLLLLIGCGEDIAGIDGTGPDDKAIFAKGSVITSPDTDEVTLNGIDYDTSSTLIVSNGEIGGSDILDSGQVVELMGSVSGNNEKVGIAKLINYRANIRGPIDNINLEEQRLTILGQVVKVNDDAFYAGGITAFESLQKGDLIEVSGFRKSNGETSATRIELMTEKNYLVTGVLKSLSPQSLTLMINDLVVDYSAIRLDSMIDNGILIKVTGQRLNDDGELIATDINIVELNTNGISQEDKVEITGFVTSFTSSQNFEVDGIKVVTKEDTVFQGELAEDSIALDVKMEVEGYLNSNFELVADRIIILVAYLTSHRDREKLTSNTLQLKWADVNADSYSLVVGNGAWSTYSNSFDGDTTSATVSDLPDNGAVVHVVLHTEQAGRWKAKRYRFFSPGESSVELTSHTDGDTLESDIALFTWSGEARRYRLIIKSGKTVIYDKYHPKRVKSAVLRRLPVNQAQLDVELWADEAGWWTVKYYRLFSHDKLKNAEIISPKNHTTIDSGTLRMEWQAIDDADGYQLIINNGIGNYQAQWEEFYDAETTSAEIHGLPSNGAKLDVQLLTIREGVPGGARKRYTFYSPGSRNCLSQYQTDRCLTPLYNEGKVLEWHSKLESNTFTWDDVDAQAYQIRIQTMDGTIYDEAFDGDITEAIIDNLLDQKGVLNFEFYTKINGWWGGSSSRFITPNSKQRFPGSGPGH